MYYWNFPFLVLLCIFNTITAEVSFVNGREYSCERSLRSFNPSTREHGHRDISLKRITSQEYLQRDRFLNESPVQRERALRTEARTSGYRSTNANRDSRRIETIHGRRNLGQTEERNQYSRFTSNQKITVERFRNLFEHRNQILHVRSMRETAPEHLIINAQGTFEVNRKTNSRDISENRHQGKARNLEVTMERRVSVEKRRIMLNNQKIRKMEHGKIESRVEAYRAREVTRQSTSERRIIRDNHEIRNRESIRPIARLSSLIEDIKITQTRSERRVERTPRERYNKDDGERTLSRNVRGFNERRQVDSIRSNTENISPRLNRERHQTRPSRRHEPHVRQRSTNRERHLESETMFVMERDITDLRDLTTNNELNARSRSNLPVSPKLIVRKSREVLVGNIQRTTRIDRVEINRIRGAPLSRSDNRDTIEREMRVINNEKLKRDVRDYRINEYNGRQEISERLRIGSPLKQNERMFLRNLAEPERIRNIPKRDVVRHSRLFMRQEDSRLSQSVRESTETLRRNMERQISSRRIQDIEPTNQRNIDVRRERNTNSRYNRDQILNKVQRSVERTVQRQDIKSEMALSSNRLVQLGEGQRNLLESKYIRQFNNNERNKREFGMNIFNKSQQINLCNWQAVFYALQALYICSVFIKTFNKSEVSKKKTWTLPWLSVPVNKLD